MTTDALTTAIRATPFRPFALKLADGRTLVIPHRDFVGYAGGRIVVVFDRTGDAPEVVDLLLVVSISYEIPMPSTAGA